MDIKDLKKFNVCIDVPNLTEAVVEEEKRNVLVKVIQEGISLNGNYYSASVVESFVPLLQEKRKMFINHLLRNNQGDYIGRDIRDWGAQITESYYENGAAYAKIHIFESEDWLFERIKKFPEEVGISIDARAKVREGKINNVDCRIVEEIIKFNSADFVQAPSAGGKALRLVAGVIDDDITNPDDLIEAVKKLDQFINSDYKQFSRIWQGLWDYIFYVVGQFKYENGEIKSEDELKKVLSKGFDDFKKSMMNLDFTKVYMYEAVQEHGNDMIEDILHEIEIDTVEAEKTENGVKYPASAYLYVPDPKKPSTWKLRVKNFVKGKLQLDQTQMGKAAAALGKGFRGNKVSLSDADKKKVKTKLRNLYKRIGVKKDEIPKQLFEIENKRGEEIMDLKQLKDEYPELVEQLKDEYIKEIQKDGELDTVKEELKQVKETVQNLEKEKTDLAKQLDDYKVKEQIANKEKMIDGLLKESKLKDEHITEVFKNTLMSLKEEDDIKQYIKDREDLVLSATGKVTDNGNEKEDVKENVSDKDEISDEEALRLMTN